MVEKSSSDGASRSPLGGVGFENGRALAERARKVIPGGAHTYAKGDDQWPVGTPPFIARGAGSHVWDLDGNEFLEYGMGLRAVTLGHAYAPVVEAVRAELEHGTNFVRPAPIEVECAETFLRLVPTMEMVKFCKDGSTAVDGAIRLARSYTGRDMVAICADHPFFSTSDWFIGTTGMPAGIPGAVRQLVHKFRYNDLDSLAALFAQHPGRIACVLLEPMRIEEPHPQYLSGLKQLCAREGAVLVFDEMITGFRWHRAGAQHVFGVTPDLASFGKALGNGFAVSALAGSREIMQLGGLEHDRDRVFLLSTTHGAETHGLAAAIATMHVYEREDVVGHLYRMGERLRAGVNRHVEALGLQATFQCVGRPCSLLYATLDAAGKPSQEMRTIFMQEIVRRGILAPSFILSYSHSPADIDYTIDVVGEALQVYRSALRDGPARYLEGRPLKPVFRNRA